MSSARRRIGVPCMFVSALAALAACGGTTEVAEPPKQGSRSGIGRRPYPPTPFAAWSARRDRCRSTVIVKNKAGETLDTTTVTFAVASGGGTVSAIRRSRRTRPDRRQTTWTLGGRRRSPDGDSHGRRAAAGHVPRCGDRRLRAATMTKVAGDAQTAAIGANVATAPSVKVVDRFGNPVARSSRSAFAVGTGGGSVNGGIVNTGNDGIATVSSWRLGTAIGANTLVATAGSLTATFTATAAVGAPATHHADADDAR